MDNFQKRLWITLTIKEKRSKKENLYIKIKKIHKKRKKTLDNGKKMCNDLTRDV